MNRRHVDPAVWRALDECAASGDLYRSPFLDCIKIGWPVRGPLNGWGYDAGNEGSLQFATPGDAHVALGLVALGWSR